MGEESTVDITHIRGCGCPACDSQQFNNSNDQGDEVSYSTLTATPSIGNAVVTGLEGKDSVLSGEVWDNGSSTLVLNYNFYTALPSFYRTGGIATTDEGTYNFAGLSSEYTSGFQAMNSHQQAAVNEILSYIENVIDVDFVKVSDSNDINTAHMSFGQVERSSENVVAHAYLPNGYFSQGDVFLNTGFWGYDSDPNSGDLVYETILHEVGHALGLTHTFSGDNTLSNAEDSNRYSVMSYDSIGINARSYMLYDIAALQELYGANTNYNSGDTDYILQSGQLYAIWDGGGVDTLDGSAINTAQTLYLTQGDYSSVGGTENIVIAYDAVIENANGGASGDTIYGNDADNIINGNGGNDTIYGSAGDDRLVGGQGTDTVSYSFDLSDFLVSIVDSVSLTIQHIAQSWTDTLVTVENFLFNGSSYSFSDLESSYGFSDFRLRTDYDGTRYYESIADTETSSKTASDFGFNGINGTLYDVVSANDDITVTIASNAPDYFRLDATNENNIILINGSHADVKKVIYGYDGNDTITAVTSGDDYLYGGAGNDTLSGGIGRDFIDGGEGVDTLTFAGATQGANVTLSGNWARNDGFGNGEAVRNIENVSGTSYADYLYGDDQDNTLEGNGGADYLYGLDGADTLLGGDGDDNLYGGNDNDTIDGGSGRDFINGGEGVDTLTFAGATQGANVTLSGNWVRNDGFGNGEAVRNIENVSGTSYADYLYGDDQDNILEGYGGADYLYGRDGADTLTGGEGSDRLEGGSGDDNISGGADNDIIIGGDGTDTLDGGEGVDTIVFYDATEGLNINVATGVLSNDGFGNNEFAVSFENVIGSEHNDTIIGSDSSNTLEGRDGNDTIRGGRGVDVINGGQGTDTVDYSDATQGVNVTLAGNWARNDGFGNAESVIDIENIEGSGYADYLYADDQDNILYGNGGTDSLYGRGGNDILYGGASNDRLYGENDDDTLIGGNGVDFMRGGSGSDILIGGDGSDYLYGDDGSDVFVFTELDTDTDQIFDFTLGGGEADTLNIADILTGFDSGTDDVNDFARLNFWHNNRTDLQINADGQGNDWQSVAIIRGADFNGVSIDDLVSGGQLETDTSVIV